MSPRHLYVPEEYKKHHRLDQGHDNLRANDNKTSDDEIARWNGKVDLKKFGVWIFAGFASAMLWIFIIMFLAS